MKYTFEDFLLPQAELEPLPASEREILEKQIADLRREVSEQVEVYRRETKQISAPFDIWLKNHISHLTDEATKRFSDSTVRHYLDEALREQGGLREVIDKTVAEIFHAHAQELFQAVCKAVLGRIQPYALKGQQQ